MPLGGFSGVTCCCGCAGCVKVTNSCASGAVQVGTLVELFEPGTTTLVTSGTTDASGEVCDIPGGTYDMRLSKANNETVTYTSQVISCGGTLTLNQRSLGRVRCWGFTCNASAGRVATTWTFTRSGYPTYTGTTGATGYVDIYLPATGTWAWSRTATNWVTATGNLNYNSLCGTFTFDPSGFGQSNSPVSTHFCGCSGFAGTPNPFQKTATVTDCGGSTSIDISPAANWCGASSFCVVRTLSNATAAPTMPNTYCRSATTLARQVCGTKPYDDKGSRSVKIGISIFANRTPGTPDGSQGSPQISKTWNAVCIEDEPPGSGGTLPFCTPADNRSETWRDGRWTCADTTVGGTTWNSTGRTIHSYNPPVVEIFFSQGEDFDQVAGSTPPPGGPPCPSIILSVIP